MGRKKKESQKILMGEKKKKKKKILLDRTLIIERLGEDLQNSSINHNQVSNIRS